VMDWPTTSPNGPGWWRAKARTFYTRAPGWAAAEAAEAKARESDWAFLVRYLHSTIPAWQRPAYVSPLAKYWRKRAAQRAAADAQMLRELAGLPVAAD